MKRRKALLVTVGSTLFPQLTDTILSPAVLDQLVSLGVTTLIVQYGRADLPIATLASASQGHQRAKDLSLDSEEGGGQRLYWDDLDVRCYPFIRDLNGMIRSSVDAVISHAGSGSILTVLRASDPKPLLVVPNTRLMDNHQEQLANEMAEQGYLMTTTVESLSTCLGDFLDKERIEGIKPFPPFDGSKIRNVMDDMMGFQPESS